MPVIPGYEAQLTPQGRFRDVRPARTFEAPVAVEKVDLSPIAEALGQIATVEMRLGQEQRARKVRGTALRSQMELLRASGEIGGDGDYETQSERFAARRKEIEDKARAELGDGSAEFETWKLDFEPTALREEFQVRSGAVKGRREKHAAGVALDLEQYAATAAQADPETAAELRERGLLAIADALKGGSISPADAVKMQTKYRSEIVGARVRWDVFKDPAGAEKRLLAGEYPDLTGDDRVRLVELASRRAETAATKALAAETRGLANATRAEKRVRDDTSKRGDEMLRAGTLDEVWLEQNRDRLDAADYRYFSGKLDGGRETSTQSFVYSNLRARAEEGEKVGPAARSALQSGQIDEAAYDKIMAAAGKTEAEKPSWNKAGSEYIGRFLKPSDMNPDPADSAAHANALDEWTLWSERHPKATGEEARREYQNIASRYTLTSVEKSPLMQKVPRHLVGSRAKPDIDATEDATVQAFLAKHGGDEAAVMNDPEFQEQSRIIEAYRLSMAKLTAARGGG